MSPIVLAHEQPFAIGALHVRPATRSLHRGDAREIVEPRVMQVLTALHAASGAVVARDDLIEACWGGRIVGDDAINRVMSRLRRVAEGIGAHSFAIETVTKVGYRLRATSGATDETAAPRAEAPTAAPSQPAPIDRRALLSTIGGVAALAGSATWLLKYLPTGRPSVPPQIAELTQQGDIAQNQGTPDGCSQALGLFKRVTELAPDYADGWGRLGIAEAFKGRTVRAGEADAMFARARAAARHALALDPHNVFAKAALAGAAPLMGHWQAMEAGLRDALIAHASNVTLLRLLSYLMGAVGRNRDAAAMTDRIVKIGPPTPVFAYDNITRLWAAGRSDDAERAAAQAAELYPMHVGIWFARLYMALYSGRPDRARMMLESERDRPPSLPPGEFSLITDIARAVENPAGKDAARLSPAIFAYAKKGAGYSENAANFAAALGLGDTVFAILDGLYFARGFDPGETYFGIPGGFAAPRNDRHTAFLFEPPFKTIHADPRFDALVTTLGLKRYWAASKTRPDYRAAA